MIVLFGESGAGKDTILNELVKKGYEKAKNYTTREKRQGDENDNNLNFVSKEKFEELWKSGKLAQRAELNGQFYGISIDSLKDNVVLISITKTIQDLKNKIKELNITSINFKTFYISVPKEERIKRMEKRGDSKQSIQERLKTDEEKFKDAKKVADYIIENNNLEKAVGEIWSKLLDI